MSEEKKKERTTLRKKKRIEKKHCKLEKERKRKNKIYQQDAIRDLESMP